MKKKAPTILRIATVLCITVYIGVFIGRASSWNITSLPDAANYISVQPETEAILIDLNKASVDDLLLLPCMTPELAEEIILYRENFGDYILIGELKRIEGMTEQIYQQIKAYVTASS